MGAVEYLNLIQTIRLDLLELFGSGYVIDHCVSAFSKEKEIERRYEEEKLYRYYLTDCLRVITENTAKSAHTEASYINNRFQDIIEPKPVITKSGDEIAEDIVRRAGLSIKTEGGTEDDAIRTTGENLH